MPNQRAVYENSVILNLEDARKHVAVIELRQAKRMMLTNDDYKVEHPNECKEFATHKTFVELTNRLKDSAKRCKEYTDKKHKRHVENRNARRR